MHNNPNTQSHQSYEENASTELLIGAFLFEVVSCNQEQGAVGEAQETNEQRFENTAMEDRKIDQAVFITQAASSNMLEIQSGQLAEEKGLIKEVRNLGQMIMADYHSWRRQ